jgi:hypothetical protein
MNGPTDEGSQAGSVPPTPPIPPAPPIPEFEPETPMPEPESDPESASEPTAAEIASAEVPTAPPVPPATPVSGSPMSPTAQRGVRTGGVLLGLTLVLVGVYALTGGIGSVFDLFRLWPLLIVLGGLMRMLNPGGEPAVKRIAEGLGSVAFGMVLLGNTLGLVPWTVWFSIVSLWPLLLVAIGVELVGRGMHMPWVRALSNLVLILGLGYAVLIMQPSAGRITAPVLLPSMGASHAFSDSAARESGITKGTAEIRVGATKLDITSGETLASIAGRAPVSDTPKLTTSNNGSETVVTVEDPGGRGVFIGTEDRSLSVRLDSQVKWSEIRLDVGAVAADADLSGLDVSAVKLNVGASDARIKVGTRAESVKVDISGGATSVTVLVPASAACTVSSTSGLSNVRVPASFKQLSGVVVIGNSTFASEGSGGPKIAISLASGVSDLRIQTY